MSMRRLAYSDDAIADLEEIRQYTAEQFGRAQARRYLQELREAIALLLEHPEMGRPVAPGSEIRCWVHKGHYHVLYRPTDGRLDVGRLVHTAREREYQRAVQALLGR